MKKHHFKITVEDESRLEKIIEIKTTFSVVLSCVLIIALFFAIIGAAIMAFSPVKTILPGYLKESQRAETEEQHLRLDSLLEVYEINTAFIDNIRNVLNLENDSLHVKKEFSEINVPFSADSLLSPSEDELKFASSMMEREKYNASVVAPVAAKNILFSPVNRESVVSDKSKESVKAEIIMAQNAYVGAVAEGVVLAVSNSFDTDEKVSIIIQHPKGFVSRYSKLGGSIVKSGERVSSGQAIAFLDNKSPAIKKGEMYLEMWHNGNRLVPYEFFESFEEKPHTPIIDKEVGRGRL